MTETINLTPFEIDQKLVKEIIEKVLAKEKKERNISVAFIEKKRMRELSKRYRNQDTATDILSFEGLNEIIVCLSEVKINAKKFGVTFEKELARVLIHGTLHLLEYSHEKMQEKQEKYLSLFFK